jgi:hypothetical protein
VSPSARRARGARVRITASGHPIGVRSFLALGAYFLFVTLWVAGNETFQAWLQAYAAAHPHAAG